MKNKLLFLTIILLSVIKGFSQAQAYPAPDIYQCGNEVFNLTVQTPVILGNQNPQQFTVTYYRTQADAAGGINPIVNPVAFVSPQQQLIFGKVSSTIDATSAITVFHLSWASGIFLTDMEDVFSCDSYILQPLQTGSYYTMPGGTGTSLAAGTVITANQLLYVYASNGEGCSDETSFTVHINTIEGINTNIEPLYGCDPYFGGTIAVFDLTQVIPSITANVLYMVTFHETSADASLFVNQIPNPTNYMNLISPTQMIWVRITDVTTGCFQVVSFQLIATDCVDDDEISGFVSLNTDGNCATFEAAVSGIPVYVTYNNSTQTTFTNADGFYKFNYVQAGQNTVYVQTGELFTSSPASQSFTMPGVQENVNFCLNATQAVNDLAVTLVPVLPARPGFEATYTLICQNLGNTALSGTASVQFDASKITYTGSSPLITLNGNTLSINYSNLLPFEKKAITLVFTVMMPQVIPIGSILTFNSSITPTVGDANIANNTDVLNQIVVNSYDPNDIMVREGVFITEEQADGYLNYTIRFQNTGTANAQKVRLETFLDANLNWNTFEPLDASHAYSVNRVGDKVIFTFENIDLAYESDNEPQSHGYSTYRIKPKSSVTLGDTMTADADIYFDFNDPIFTNTVSTTIQETAGLKDATIGEFSIFPNPASGIVNILLLGNYADDFSVTITNVLGKQVIKDDFKGNTVTLNTSFMTAGVYFINVSTGYKQHTQKLVIK